jgi:hypothetical protein
MKRDKRGNDQTKAGEKLPTTGNAKNKKSKEPNKSAKAPNQAETDKKKSPRRSWRSASPITKIGVIIAAVGAVGVVGYFIAYIIVSMSSARISEEEHRPRLIMTSHRMDALNVYDPHKIIQPTVGMPLAASIYFQNTGGSTAFHLRVHRHILMQSQLGQLRIEPPDDPETEGDTLDKGQIYFVTAPTVRDTYAQESTTVDASSVVSWDGTFPVYIFGRVSYQDGNGTQYCLPFFYHWLNAGGWADATEWTVKWPGLPTHLYKLSDLCPSGQR